MPEAKSYTISQKKGETEKVVHAQFTNANYAKITYAIMHFFLFLLTKYT